MIFNGIDVVKISRIKKSLKNPLFLKRVFTDEEREYFIKKNNAPQTVAGVYAAKEAFLKALGKGIGDIPFTDISICYDVLGKPFFKFNSKAFKIVDKMKLEIALSISHDGDVAVASVFAKGNNMYKTVIFDLDGTLIDTSKGVLESAVYAAKKLGIDPPCEETMRRFLGPPLSESFKDILGVQPQDIDRAIELYREEYDRQKFNGVVYDGIIELLEYLKQHRVRIAVATLKLEKFALIVLEEFGLSEYFDMICGTSKDNDSHKEALISKILYNFECAAEDAVLIGDGKYDALGSKLANVDFIAVQYGFARENEFEGANPIAFVKSPKEIAYYL